MRLVNDAATKAKLLQDEEVQSLWNEVVMIDSNWRRARDVVQAGEREFPDTLTHKLSPNIAECSVAADSVLRGRENRIWVTDYEPLRTTIMQKIHNSHMTSHPGKDSVVRIILRRWFWPKLKRIGKKICKIL